MEIGVVGIALIVGLGLIWYLRKGADWQLIMRTLRNLVTRAREMAVAS